MHQFYVPIEDIMDLPPIVDEIHLELSEKVEQNKFQQAEKQSLAIFIEFEQKKEMIIIHVNQKTMVQELKEIIMKKYPEQLKNIDDFHLYYQGNKMYQSNLFNYKIQDNGLIEVRLNQAVEQQFNMKVYEPLQTQKKNVLQEQQTTIVIADSSRAKTFTIQVHPDTFIGEIIKDLEEIIFFHNNVGMGSSDNFIHLKFCSNYLSPQQTFAHYGITNGACLELITFNCGGCFPYYAPITLADKSQKLISQIIKGDEILCYNYEEKEFKSGIVLGITKTKQKIQLIRIETETRVIDCTADHPFYTQSGWKAFEPHPDFQINNLTLEDKLLNQDKTFIKIISIEKLNQFDYVYNLKLKYPNNYLVFGFVAHNMNTIYVDIEGKDVDFEYFPDMPIQQIKVMIFKRRGIPIENQQLYHLDQLMDDEKTIQDYLDPEQKQMHIKLKLHNDKVQQQQQQQFVNSNSNLISVDIISNKSRYKLLLRNDIKIKYLKDIVNYFEEQMMADYAKKERLILIDGQQYSTEFDEKIISELPKIQQIWILSKEEGVLSISFYKDINDVELTQLSQLKKFLQTLQLKDFNVEKYLEITLLEINQDKKKAGIYQKYKLHHLIALKLWTSNILYRQLNLDLRSNSYVKWRKYLKCLIDGLKSSQYYRGHGFRGIRDYNKTEFYQLNSTIQWRDITAISLKKEVAERFSNSKGMIFDIEMISSKDISQISVFPNEQEVIMFPFSTYQVLNVTRNNNQPIVVELKEIPLPRNTKNILWVDDNPENNYQLATKFETQDEELSIIFCTSTTDAISIVKSYKWLLLLETTQFRIVSDMVRIENHITNYTAGVDLLKRLNQELNYKGEILFFVFDEEYSLKSLQQTKYYNYFVTKKREVLEKFIRFESK